MKVFIYNEISVAAIYGIGTYIEQLASCIKVPYMDINIITSYSMHKEFGVEVKNDIKYWNIPVALFNINNNRDDYYYAIISLLKLYMEDSPELIFHLNYLHSNHVFAQYLKQNFQCKIVTTVHYMEWAILFKGNISGLNKALKKKDIGSIFVSKSLESEKNLIHISDKVICLTENAVDLLHKVYNADIEKFAVIPNGLCDVFKGMFDNKTALETKTKLREKYNFSADEKIILFAGRLDNIKGLNFLIDAFFMLLQENKNIHLLIVGNTSNYEYYLNKTASIARKVSYTGKVHKEQLYEFMSIADIGIVPSIYEPFGYVAIEMMMHALPVVSTSSLNEVFDNDINGKIVPVIEQDENCEIDPSMLSEAINELLHNPELAANIGQAGRKKFERTFDIKYMKHNMLKLYNNLLINL